VTLDDTGPIAKLIEEAQAIVVPADSPYQGVDQLITAWKANPQRGGRRRLRAGRS
jgi:putative tricarboxylic transport membrane protein